MLKALLHFSLEVFNFFGLQPGLWLGLAPGWPWPRGVKAVAEGRFWSTDDEKVKVLGMKFSIVENISGTQESIFRLFRSAQLSSHRRIKQLVVF